MKSFFVSIFVSISLCLAAFAGNAASVAPYSNARIFWDMSTEKSVNNGGYARVIELQDGRLMCAYQHSGIAVAVSEDGGNSWSGYTKIATDSTGRLWVATEDGGLYTLENGIFTRFSNADMGYNVHSLCLDPDNNCMWVGTFRNGLFRVDLRTLKAKRYLAGKETGLASDAIFAIARRSNGELFFGTTQGLFKYDPDDDKFECIVLNDRRRFFCYCLFCDTDDNLWVGSTQYGLFCIDTDDNITQWVASDREPEFAEDWVTSIYRDARGTIWIGTNNSGLYTLSSPGGHIKPFKSTPDLSSRTICSINEDNSGHLWVGTSSGLYRINPAKATSSDSVLKMGCRPINSTMRRRFSAPTH